jgi:hypothetical protein
MATGPEQLRDYCPTSHLPMDDMISELLDFGFTRNELKQLERLSNPEVLALIPISERNLKHNVKLDVVRYLNTWAFLLEETVLHSIQINDLRSVARETTVAQIG